LEEVPGFDYHFPFLLATVSWLALVNMPVNLRLNRLCSLRDDPEPSLRQLHGNLSGITLASCLELMMANTTKMHVTFVTLIPWPKKTRDMRTESSCRAVIIQVKESGPRTRIA